MKITYFEDTDTLLLELAGRDVRETREVSEDVYVDLDAEGRVVGITVEHARGRDELSRFTFEHLGQRPSASA